MSVGQTPSIGQLQELPIPVPPFSYWPHTWGWWAVAAVLACLTVVLVVRRQRRWQRNLYRREALSRLAVLEHRIDDPAQRLGALREVPELIKRVALCLPPVPPPEQPVATLRGESWQAFLQRHATQPLPDDFATQLATLAYEPADRLLSAPTAQVHELLSVCRQWIEVHHVAV